MSLKLGKYHALINPVHYKMVDSITEGEKRDIDFCLDELAYILEGDFEWFLSGGLSIPATLGDYYRVHCDIDIGVSENDLGKLVETTKDKNYGLFSRELMTKVSQGMKIDIYREISTEEAVENKNLKLRLLRLNRRGNPVRHDRLLDYFDIYMHHFEGDDLVSNNGKARIAENSNRPIYFTQSGKIISLIPLEYTVQIKEKSKTEVDIHDLRVISQRLS